MTERLIGSYSTNTLFYGSPVAHNWDQVGLVNYVVEAYDVKTFIEIGSFFGGLFMYFAPRAFLYDDFKCIGVEISDGMSRVSHHLRKLPARCCVINGDCFAPNVAARIVKEIHETKGRALLYCDGGNKAKECIVFGPNLRSGDFLMAHDLNCEYKMEDLSPVLPLFGPLDGASDHIVHQLTLVKK